MNPAWIHPTTFLIFIFFENKINSRLVEFAMFFQLIDDERCFIAESTTRVRGVGDIGESGRERGIIDGGSCQERHRVKSCGCYLTKTNSLRKGKHLSTKESPFVCATRLAETLSIVRTWLRTGSEQAPNRLRTGSEQAPNRPEPPRLRQSVTEAAERE